MRLTYTQLITVFCILFGIQLSGQRPDGDIGPTTGSGSIFGDPVVRYSTMEYFKQGIKLSDKERFEGKELERHIHNRRRHHIKGDVLHLSIAFHNHTNLNQRRFQAEVSAQTEFLRRDFTTNVTTQERLLPLEEETPQSLQLIEFAEAESNYRPKIIAWENWDSFDGVGYGAKTIDIHVVERLPDKLGHGYAQFGWIDHSDKPDIVIRLSSFGNGAGDFKGGKVLTHLIGNYLGLYPLTGAAPCEDDGILDSPIHNTAINFCSDGKPPRSLCDNQFMAPNNFMSHTPDDCKDSFTPGQWKKMISTIEYLNQENE